jgi:3',5'-cyclic AMP phosphodiesterase CpdA
MVAEVNAMAPDVVVVTGDMTDMGYRREFEHAAELLDRVECERKLVIPGNHDARNVGEVHFETLWGARNSWMDINDNVRIVGLDSSEPDLDQGRIGRERYRWMEELFADAPDRIKVVAIHHHLMPVPGTGRERNVIFDAGDLLSILTHIGVDVVLCGHKHVPNVWRLDDLLIVNTGTATSLKLRGRTRPAYTVVVVDDDRRVRVSHRTPGGEEQLVADYRKVNRAECVWRPSYEYEDDA